jgi:hypothetical protein
MIAWKMRRVFRDMDERRPVRIMRIVERIWRAIQGEDGWSHMHSCIQSLNLFKSGYPLHLK